MTDQTSVTSSDDNPVERVVDPPSDKERLRLAYVRLALLRRLADKVAPITAAEKRVVMDLTDPGSTAKPTVDPTDRQDRTPFVTVSHAYGRQSLVYYDDEFIPWVLAEYPSEVMVDISLDASGLSDWAKEHGFDIDSPEHVIKTAIDMLASTKVQAGEVTLTVRESFKTRLGDLFKTHGRIVGPQGETPYDPDKPELGGIRGVGVKQGKPFVMVSHPNDDRLAELWAASVRTEIPAMLEEGTK